MNRLGLLLSLLFTLSAQAQEPSGQITPSGFTRNQTVYPESFRSLFTQVYREVHGRALSQEELERLIYLPKDGLFAEQKSDGNGCAHCQVQTALRDISTRQLFDSGRFAPIRQVSPEDVRSVWRQMEERETLVVVVPGIFGEFIDKLAMDEVFRNPGSFADEWDQRFEAQTQGRACSAMSPLEQDRYCDERNLLRLVDWEKNPSGRGQTRLDELFRLGSWDVGSRRRLSVLVFNMEGFSLESLGDESDRASIFNRRLEKFFSVLGRVPENVLFVGYSRGTAFGLEMLSQAHSARRPWVDHVKGFVSLGGVVFGSSLADEALHDPDSKIFRQLSAIDEVVQKLKLVDSDGSWMERLRAVSANTKALFEFGVKIVRLENLKIIDGNPFANLDDSTVVDGLSLFSLTKRLIRNFGLLNYGLTVRSYNSDVLRFQMFFRSAVVGVRQLSTDHRLNWWRTARLPQHLRLYSVIALMDSPESPLVNNQIGYQPESADDQMLRKNWQHYASIRLTPLYEGSGLNDSQVSLAKAHFWPQVIRELNPQLANLRSQPLAIVGTHHWGLALPIVNPTVKVKRDGGSLATDYLFNPFPRKAMLFSLATAFNWDLRASNGF